MNLKSVVQGAGLGAALMYLFDPQRGRRRRARLIDQYEHARHCVQDFLLKSQRDLSNRASGVAHEASSLFSSGEADDRVIAERVRSTLGRHVSHPHAIQVESQDGRVILSGQVLEDELGDVISAVCCVRGVRDVENRLDMHQVQGHASSLQGAGSTPRQRYDIMQNNWSPATRSLAQVTGLTLMGNCLISRGLTSMLLGSAGFALFVRAATNRSFGQITGTQIFPPASRFQRTVTIHAPADKVWDFLTDFERVGSFMPSVKFVQNLGEGRYRWGVCLPGGRVVELEERITESVPQERLSWQSTSIRPMYYAGTITLQRESDEVTRVNVHFEYTAPGGLLGEAVASFFGLDPESKFHDAVSRVKTFLETGHPPHDAHDVSVEAGHTA